MKKKTLIAIITILAFLLFGVSSFAENNMASDAVNGIRNFVGGAENVVEDAASGIAGGIREGISDVENGAEDLTKDNAARGGIMTDTNNGDYTATRTSATGTGNTFLGMGETAWTFLILGILGVITVALVWYYGKQNEMTTHNHDDNY